MEKQAIEPRPAEGQEGELPLEANYEETVQGGAIERARLELKVVVIAVLVSSLIGVAIASYLAKTIKQDVRTQVASATIRASEHNCLTQRAGRDSANRERFALRELLSFDTDILTASAKAPHQTAAQKKSLADFLATERQRLQQDVALARVTIPNIPNITNYSELFPLLANIPQISCGAALLTGGP